MAACAVQVPGKLVCSLQSLGISLNELSGSTQIYRPLTAFFFGGKGFPLLYDFFLIYRNSSALEKET